MKGQAMAENPVSSLPAALNGALGAITSTRQAVKAAAAQIYAPPPVEDHGPPATPAPANVAKP